MVLDLLLFLWLMLDSGMSVCLVLDNSNESRFAEAVLKGLTGEKGIVTPTFVYLQGIPGGEEIFKETGCEFFSVPVELGVCLFHNQITLLIEIDHRRREGTQPPDQPRRERKDTPQGLRRRPEGQYRKGRQLRTQPTAKVVFPSVSPFPLIRNLD